MTRKADSDIQNLIEQRNAAQMEVCRLREELDIANRQLGIRAKERLRQYTGQAVPCDCPLCEAGITADHHRELINSQKIK